MSVVAIDDEEDGIAPSGFGLGFDAILTALLDFSDSGKKVGDESPVYNAAEKACGGRITERQEDGLLHLMQAIRGDRETDIARSLMGYFPPNL